MDYNGRISGTRPENGLGGTGAYRRVVASYQREANHLCFQCAELRRRSLFKLGYQIRRIGHE